MGLYINKSTSYTLYKDTCPRRSILRKGRASAKIRDLEAPVSPKILKVVDCAKSLFSDTKPFDKNGS